jgi:hypothetical protein
MSTKARSHRENRGKQGDFWWLNDYRFESDVSLGDRLRAGHNAIALRCHDAIHVGGIFRRPFLYAPRSSL